VLRQSEKMLFKALFGKPFWVVIWVKRIFFSYACASETEIINIKNAILRIFILKNVQTNATKTIMTITNSKKARFITETGLSGVCYK